MYLSNVVGGARGGGAEGGIGAAWLGAGGLVGNPGGGLGGGGGFGVPPRTAVSSSCAADAIACTDNATMLSSSSPLSARTVTKLPAAVFTVILMGASVLGTIFSLLKWSSKTLLVSPLSYLHSKLYTFPSFFDVNPY